MSELIKFPGFTTSFEGKFRKAVLDFPIDRATTLAQASLPWLYAATEQFIHSALDNYQIGVETVNMKDSAIVAKLDVERNQNDHLPVAVIHLDKSLNSFHRIRYILHLTGHLEDILSRGRGSASEYFDARTGREPIFLSNHLLQTWSQSDIDSEIKRTLDQEAFANSWVMHLINHRLGALDEASTPIMRPLRSVARYLEGFKANNPYSPRLVG